MATMPSLLGHLVLALPNEGDDTSALEASLGSLEGLFAMEDPAARHGSLLVVTEDAGCQTAVRFWADALGTGLALASPGAFPNCLANAPCGLLARRFGILGPSFTWMTAPGEMDADVADIADLADFAGFAGTAHAALGQALSTWLDHLAWAQPEGGVHHAWLVALRLAAPRRLAVWHWAVSA